MNAAKRAALFAQFNHWLDLRVAERLAILALLKRTTWSAL